jgi:hypothetical protein
MGSLGYERAAELSYEPGECIIEVGAGSSTIFLAQLGAHRTVPVYSIDVRSAAAFGLPAVHAIRGRAEDVLANWERRPVPKFAWVDGYDWPYSFLEGTPHLAQVQREYAERGEEITEEASQASHFQIARALHRLTGEGCAVAFDDTWYHPRDGWRGKAGTAIPYLYRRGWSVVDMAVGEEPDDGYVLLTR